MNYYVTTKPFRKISNDFRKLNFMNIQVNDINLKNINKLYYNFPISADHICSLLKTDLGSHVVCLDYDLDEITFKDIDIIE